MKKYFFIIILSLPLIISAQESDLGNWIMYFGSNKLSDKYSLHTEIQYRNHTVVPNNTEQLLLRTGINYHFQSNAFATAGYAFIPSYVFESEQSAPETKEHRIWQQLIVTNKIGKAKLEHRYRAEQRWINGDYRNRLRYRIMLFYPLNKPTLEKGALFLGLYDEVFLNTKGNYFDRNRLYGALGYHIEDNISLQVGMLNQTLSSFNKWYLQFALVYNLDFRPQD